MAASDIYAYKKHLIEYKANPVGLEGLRHQNAIARLDYTHQLKTQEIGMKDKLDRDRDRIKYNISTGYMVYDENNEPIINPIYAGEFVEPGKSGQVAQDVNIAKLNEESFSNSSAQLTSGFIDYWFMDMSNLIKTGAITEQEVWKMIKLTPYGEAENKGEATSGYQAFWNLNGRYQKDKEKIKKDLTSSNKVLSMKSGFDGWVDKNGGHSVAVGYTNRNDGIKIQRYAYMQDNFFALEEENNTKIRETLEKSVAAKGITDKKIASKIVDLYMRASQDAEFSDEYFQKILLNKIGKENLESLVLPYKNASTESKFEKSNPDLFRKVNDEDLKAEYMGKEKALSKEAWASIQTKIRNGEIKGKDYYLVNDNGVKGANGKTYYYPSLYENKLGDYKGESEIVSQNEKARSIKAQDIFTGLFEDMGNNYIKLVTDPNPKTGLTSMIPVVADTKSGTATLAANTSSRMVNLAVPYAPGTKAFIESFSDIMRINWNQDNTKYKISTQGLEKSDSKEDAQFAQSLMSEYMSSLKAGAKVQPFKISQSQVALEDRNLNSITIHPTMDFLKKHITSTMEDGEITTDKTAVATKIDEIFKNGISFIAPKGEWTNEFISGNRITPAESIINRKGSISYTDPNGAGNYNIVKVTDVPGVDYSINYTTKILNEDGSMSVMPVIPKYIPKGNSLDSAEDNIYSLLLQITNRNLETFRKFHQEGNQEAIAKAQKNFQYTSKMAGFNY